MLSEFLNKNLCYVIVGRLVFSKNVGEMKFGKEGKECRFLLYFLMFLI